MNYYVLYCQSQKTEKVCERLNKKEHINAFVPYMEKYIGSKDEIVLQVMFPGYLFIKTELNQENFDLMLSLMDEERDGIIKELKKDDVTALTLQEIDLLNRLLDDKNVLRMSQGYRKDGRTIVEKGPLVDFQEDIVATDKKDRLAILHIQFLKRRIKAGLLIK